MSPRRVVVVAFPGAQLLDIAGPIEVLQGANQLVPDTYAVEVVAREPGQVPTSSGLPVTADRPLPAGALDTLVVAGGPGVREALKDDELVGWLSSAAPRARRVVGVCTGALLLAHAGLLDGRRAATHWVAADQLAETYPAVTIESDPLYVRDGDVWTSAGVTAGMDLALALVEDDLGRQVALEVARWLVWFVRRPGGQAQFRGPLIDPPDEQQAAESRALRELQSWVLSNLTADLRVPLLAERACMSQRNFARTFRRELGLTPGAYVERARVEAARQALVDGPDDSVDVVAARCGFGTAETMRRAFHRRLGVGPAEYRQRFRPSLGRVG